MNRYQKRFVETSDSLIHTCSSCMHFKPNNKDHARCEVWKDVIDSMAGDKEINGPEDFKEMYENSFKKWLDEPIDKNICEFWMAKE